MNTNLPIPTNKIDKLFCHSLEKGSPVFAVVVLFFLLGTIIIAPPALAISCFDPATGISTEVNEIRDCPSGSTLDPGYAPVRNGGFGDSRNPDGSFRDTDTGGEITTFGGLLARMNAVLNAIVPFLIGLAVFLVLYGIFGYVTHSADEEKRAEARKFILWGIIFIFLMISIWGLINILSNTFSLDKSAPKVESVFPELN